MRNPSSITITQVLRTRRRRIARQPGRSLPTCGLIFSLLVSLVSAVGILVAIRGYTSLTTDLPAVSRLEDLLDPRSGFLLQPTRFYDRSGEHVLLTLANPAAQERRFLNLDHQQADFLPASLISATLAIQDPAFYTHPGYALRHLLENRPYTLAERLSADLLLGEEPPSLERALRMRLLAAQITREYGREQILIWYLNSANYGRLAFGAEAAARVYFDKPVSRLSTGEAAMLAATNLSPALNPLDAPEDAHAGMLQVIAALEQQGWISVSSAAQARQNPPTIHAAMTAPILPAPAFASLAFNQLAGWIDPLFVERGGLKVITTLDYDYQDQLTCTTQAHLARLHSSTIASTSACPAALLLPTLPSQGIQERDVYQAASILFDPTSGEVLAFSGETNTGHSPGTLITPFVYLAGLARGFTPSSMFWDIPDPDTGISNLDAAYHGPVRLRTALANDYLTPAAQVFQTVGNRTIWQTLRRFGFSYPETAFESPAILSGGETVTLVETAQAYAVLANKGLQAGWQSEGSSPDDSLQPLFILRVETSQGGRLSALPGQRMTRPIVNAQLTYLVTHILSDEAARWPALGHPNPLEIGRPAAAKLGLTQSGRDQWVFGYTPELVTGVWLGIPPGEQPTAQLPRQSAAALWHAIIQYVHQTRPTTGWSEPVGINSMVVCDPSGLLPTQECPQTVNEIFLAGTEPSQPDNLYRSFQINRETGQLATVYTPPEQMIERVYMLVPPDAKIWAEQAGIPVPPASYDLLTAASGNSLLKISSPTPLAYVKGELQISGSAAGEGFSAYRLRVGQGLNPRSWIQIGTAEENPVEEGVLGVWDTGGLSGLYAIQLSVIYADSRVETAVVQVTVDNHPPTVTILNPHPDEIVTATDTGVNLQADVQDNLAIAGMSFYMDGRLVGKLTQPPYLLQWRASLGDHTLRVAAEDMAGNSISSEINFSVEN